MATKIDPVASIEFIFEECARFQKPEVFTNVVPNSSRAREFFYRLPHPTSSWSFLICGRAADERLQELAGRAATQAGIARNVSNRNVRDKLAAIIVRKFLNEKRPVDRKNVDRALAEAARAAAKECSTVTHFVPCHLMHARSPEKFAVGPVIFRPQHAFRKRLCPDILRNRNHLRTGRKYLRRTLKYYRSFDWVAEVTIPDCDESTSEEVAARAVAAALDCLHLLLEPRYTHKMRVGGPDLTTDWRGELKVSEARGVAYSVGHSAPASVAFQEGWHHRFDDRDYKQALRLCGVALESIVDPRLERPLSTRFLDAALWFGEAVRETSRAAKVVKYATALERMVMTDEKDDITNVMSQRVAAICCNDPRDSFDDVLRDAKRLYSVRSKLVHGSLSPHSPDVREGILLGAKLGEITLLRTLLAMGESSLKHEKVSTKRLARWFNAGITRVLAARDESQKKKWSVRIVHVVQRTVGHVWRLSK